MTALVDLARPRVIHLVGVGGAGISAIGLILAAMGHRVSGADVNRTKVWGDLEAAGIDVALVEPGELFSSAGPDVEVIAYSTAFPPDPEDLGRGAAADQQVVNRAGILAAICARRATVAVSGTHGKTSTTALLATLLAGVGADPSWLVGAVPAGLGQAARWGGDDGVFVVEADESDGSFIELGAATAAVTNVDEDHLDHWGSIERIEAGFDRFLSTAQRSVVCIDDPSQEGRVDGRAQRLARAHGSVTVGESDGADYLIHDVEVERLTTTFGLRVGDAEVGPVSIGTPGRHHARNAAVALATAVQAGVDPAAGVAALAAYRGVSRRFEVVGEARGVTVVDDYAHNPGKVRALLAAAREAGWSRVVAVFQPHRWSRTRDQGAAFGAALALADLVVVTEVFGAGEEPVPDAGGRTVVAALLDERPRASVAWLPTLDDVVAWAPGALRDGDLCLTVGAGDVASLGPRLLEALGGAR